METQAITTTGTTGYTQGTTNRMIASDFDTFLKMLTVQIQNQDPLNPVEASDYAVQLATFSSVEQQVLTNDLLKGLSGQMNLTGLAQMGDWVGREVRAAMSTHFNGSPITISPNPAAVSDEVFLVVRDASGNEVQRRSIPVSAEPFDWVGMTSDGAPLPNGVYSFTVESWSKDELILEETAEVYARVDEVRAGTDGIQLMLRGGVQIGAGSVTGLRQG